MLQQLNGAEMFMHFVDTHTGPDDLPAEALARVLSTTEVTEIAMHEISMRLLLLTKACRAVLVPQKWIGSSVALGFDDGELPPRGSGELSIRKSVRVNLFDWGRSE